MVIGLLTMDLHIPDAGSLKSKRFVLKSLKDRVRNKHNVSIAEIGSQDLWQRCQLAAAVVSNDSAFAHKVLTDVAKMAERHMEVEVLDYRIEML